MTGSDAVEAGRFDLDSTLCVSEQSDEAVHAAVFDGVGVEPFLTPAHVRAVDGTDLPTADSEGGFYELRCREAAAIAGADLEAGVLAALAEETVDVVDETAVSGSRCARRLTSLRDRWRRGCRSVRASG